MRRTEEPSNRPNEIEERIDGVRKQMQGPSLAFAATPLLFVLVAYLALPEATVGGPFTEPEAQSWLLGILLIAAVIGGYVALVALPRRSAPQRLADAGETSPGKIIEKVRSNATVRMAVVESVGLLGFVATILSGSLAFVVTLAALTLVMNAALWIRRSAEWEEVRTFLKRADRS